MELCCWSNICIEKAGGTARVGMKRLLRGLIGVLCALFGGLLGVVALSGGIFQAVIAGLLASFFFHHFIRLVRLAGDRRFDPLEIPARYVALAGLLPVGLWLWVERVPPVVWQPPQFSQLVVSTGILKQGLKGDRYLLKPTGTSLQLLCADGIGRGSLAYCLTGHDAPYLGKVITVWHTAPFRIGTEKAHVFEARANTVRFVRYEQVVAHIREHQARQAAKGPQWALLLVTGWFYWFAVSLWHARRTRGRHFYYSP